MNAWRSSRPESDSAASCSPAAQPSVRWCRRATSSGSRPSASPSLRSAAASVSVKRRSPARISSQLTADPQAPERERRLGAARDHDLQRLGPAIEQEGDGLVDARVGDDVVVVEDEDDVRRLRRQVVDERRQHDVGRVGRTAEMRERLLARSRGDGPQRRDHALEEAHRVVVGAIERQPRQRHARRRACHAARSVVLPEPTGAWTRIRRAPLAAVSVPTSRARGTSPERTPGIRSLVVARIAPDGAT